MGFVGTLQLGMEEEYILWSPLSFTGLPANLDCSYPNAIFLSRSLDLLASSRVRCRGHVQMSVFLCSRSSLIFFGGLAVDVCAKCFTDAAIAPEEP